MLLHLAEHFALDPPASSRSEAGPIGISPGGSYRRSGGRYVADAACANSALPILRRRKETRSLLISAVFEHADLHLVPLENARRAG